MGKHGYLILCTGLAADKKKKHTLQSQEYKRLL